MTDAQCRLIAAALALVAGAVLCLARPTDPSVGPGLMIIAGVLFAVEYVRTQLPPRDGKPGPG